jgi:YesN/AraC family two-component response regulator
MIDFPKLIHPPHLTSIIEINRNEMNSNKEINKHEQTEIIFILEGQGEFTINQQKVTANRGNLILINSSVEHKAVAIDDCFKGFVLTFTNLQLSNLPEGFIIAPNQSPIINVQNHHITVNKYIEDIYQEFQENALGSEEIISSLLVTLIIKIIRFLNTTNKTTTLSEKVINYITENYNRDISLNELASVVFISPYHLAHTFKDEVGVSPIQYLINHRIDEAKNMLIHTDLTIREIAFRVGYPNSNYFTLLFKKLTGYSPGKFRKNF